MRPLVQENALELTVRVGCPILCAFCPQDVLRLRSQDTGKKVLQVKDLQTIIANASRRRPVRIVFAGFAEPCSVAHIEELLWACEQDPGVLRITMYTTGEGLSTDLLESMARLEKLYPDRQAPGNRYINFHVRPPSDYSLMKGADGEIWQRIGQISRLFPEARFVCVTEDVPPERLSQMERELGNHGFRLTTRATESRAGNVASINGRRLRYEPTERPVSCCKVRHHTLMPVVLPDGSTYACCNDYGRELPVGNLLGQSWEELDFSRILQAQSDPHSDVPCFRGCHLAEPESGDGQVAASAGSIWV